MSIADKIIALTSSRRFWAAVGGIVFLFLKDVIGLDETTANGIVAFLIAWIVGDSINKTGVIVAVLLFAPLSTTSAETIQTLATDIPAGTTVIIIHTDSETGKVLSVSSSQVNVVKVSPGPVDPGDPGPVDPGPVDPADPDPADPRNIAQFKLGLAELTVDATNKELDAYAELYTKIAGLSLTSTNQFNTATNLVFNAAIRKTINSDSWKDWKKSTDALISTYLKTTTDFKVGWGSIASSLLSLKNASRAEQKDVSLETSVSLKRINSVQHCYTPILSIGV